MITQNDEKYLKDCFLEIKQFVDEIVIVDIGSVDKSVTIAKKAGAEVYQVEWNNNYSEVKNFCLNNAKGRWILFLQPNERIAPEQLKGIAPLLDNPTAEGYLLYINQSLDHYRITSPVQSLRLFRNHKEYRYQYKSFACIPDELIMNIKDCSIRIQQHTYSDFQSDISLFAMLKEELDEKPENCYLQYLYGIELINENHNEESIEYLESARRNVNLDYLYAPHLYKCLAWSYVTLNRYNEAIDVLNEGFQHFPFYTDLLVIQGDLKKRQHRFTEAVQDLETSYKIKEQPNFGVPAPEIDSSVILESLGEIHDRLLNYKFALDCYQHAYDLNGANHKLLYKIGDLAPKVDTAEVLNSILKKAAESKDFEQLMILIDVLYRQHEYSQVLVYLEYLETYLGKEQIDSIRDSCNRMLDELKKVNEGEPCHIPLEQQDREEVYNHMENLLWLKLTHEAKLLLPLLLNGENDDDQLIKLAILWADKGDLEVIRQIFRKVSDHEKQIEFKQKIIMELLRNDHIEAAQELKKLEDSLPLEALEYVLESVVTMNKLEKWVGELRSKKPEEDTTESAGIPLKTKPEEALLAFYHSLGLSRNTMKDGSPEQEDEEITCDEVHCEIGNFYEKLNKREAVLSAYLRALQRNPFNDLVQSKIINLVHDNPDQFHAVLDGKSFILESSWFHDKEGFIHYIHGLIHLKNHQFNLASESFDKITNKETGYPLAFAYMIFCLWMEGNEADAEKLLDEQKRLQKVDLFIFLICKSYVLDKLTEGYQKYAYSEIILREKQRVNNLG